MTLSNVWPKKKKNFCRNGGRHRRVYGQFPVNKVCLFVHHRVRIYTRSTTFFPISNAPWRVPRMKKPRSEIRKQALYSVCLRRGYAHTKTHAFALITLVNRRFLPNLTNHILSKEKRICKKKKIFRMFNIIFYIFVLPRQRNIKYQFIFLSIEHNVNFINGLGLISNLILI